MVVPEACDRKRPPLAMTVSYGRPQKIDKTGAQHSSKAAFDRQIAQNRQNELLKSDDLEFIGFIWGAVKSLGGGG